MHPALPGGAAPSFNRNPARMESTTMGLLPALAKTRPRPSLPTSPVRPAYPTLLNINRSTTAIANGINDSNESIRQLPGMPTSKRRE